MLNMSPSRRLLSTNLSGLLGLLDLLAAHAAGAVDDEDDRLGDRLRRRRL